MLNYEVMKKLILMHDFFRMNFASGFLNLTGTSERRIYVNTNDSSLLKLPVGQRIAQKRHSGAVRKKLLKEKKISEGSCTVENLFRKKSTIKFKKREKRIEKEDKKTKKAPI